MAKRYEPIRFYDAPDVLLTQAFQGQTTFSNVMNTFLRPTDLSLEERDSFADGLKDAMGNHSVTNAVVDVMKNPFFWLLFLTSPVAHPALKGGKTILFDRGAQLGAYMKQNPGLFGRLQVLTANEYFSGTAVGSVVGEISRHLDNFQRTLADWMSNPIYDFKVLHKLKTLDPAMEANPQKKELIEKFWSALYTGLAKAHVDQYMRIATSKGGLDVVRYLPDEGLAQGRELGRHRVRGTKNVKEVRANHDREVAAGRHPDHHLVSIPHEGGMLDLHFPRRRIPGWGGEDPFKVLAEMKGMEIFKAYDKVRHEYAVRMFYKPWVKGMDDGFGNIRNKPDRTFPIDGKMRPYIVDPNKIFNLYGAQNNPLFKKMPLGGETEPVSSRGMQLITQMMDKDAAEALWVGMAQAGKASGINAKGEWINAAGDVLDLPFAITPAGFAKNVTNIINKTLDPSTYVPRNVIEVLGAKGVPLTPDQVRGLKRGPQIFSTGRAVPRAKADVFLHPEDMERGMRTMGWSSPEFMQLYKTNKERLEARLASPAMGGIGEAVVHRIDPILAMERYTKDMDESYALFIAPVSEEAIAHQHKYWSQLPADKKAAYHRPTMTGVERARVGVPFDDIEKFEGGIHAPMGGFNNADMLWAEYNLMGNAHAQSMLADVLLPTTLGRLTSAQHTGRLAASAMQQAAKWIRSTPVKKWAEESGEWGKHFGRKLDMMADLPLEKLMTSRDIANWLYVTHLGVNMSSVLLNLMQPLLMGGPMVGMDNLIYGYKKAFQELGQYYKARRGMGLRISDAAKENVIRDTFRWANYQGKDLLDIHPNIHHTVDAIVEGQMSYVPPSWREYLMKDAPMKLFEKAEWLNRLVMSHATERMVTKMNPLMKEADIARNVHDFVRQTQYGAHVMNTPLAFLPHKPVAGGGQSSWIFSDPTFRQFMTFPLRTATGFFYTPSLLAKEGVEGMKRGWPIVVANLRAAGYGAVAYELGRDLVGGDVSRGLYPQAAFDIIQGDRFIEGTDAAFPVQLPPVLDIAATFGQWIMGPKDADVLSRWVSRTAIPGGVALRRLTSMIPSPDQDWPLGRLARQMQSFYVGWDEPRVDGLVPVYKPDGTIVSYQKPQTMILRALGMDMRKFATDAQMDRWLAKNRDESSRIKREFISAVLNQDWSHADGLAGQYQKKYGIPIKLTRQQLASQMRTRTITRTERLLDRMSPDLREQYAQAIQHKAPQLGLSPEQLAQPTSTQRTEAGAQRPTPLSPEAQKYLEAYMSQDPTGVFRRFGSAPE